MKLRAFAFSSSAILLGSLTAAAQPAPAPARPAAPQAGAADPPIPPMPGPPEIPPFRAGSSPSPSAAAPTPPDAPAHAPLDATAAGGAGAAAGTAPPAAAAEEDDMSMTFHAKRPKDMQEFAADSLQEIHVQHIKARYALNLFGDIALGAQSRSEGDTKPAPAFAVGVMDLLFNAELNGSILATTEISFEYEPNAPLAELERLHLRWQPNKIFFVEAGRFHTDIGYWNVAYHHGKWLQLPIERPRQIALHGGLLPTHWVGAQAGLALPVGAGALRLVSSVGSARDPIGSGGHLSHGTANTPINGVHVKLESAGIGVENLHFGVSGVYDRIPAEQAFTRPALPDQGINEYIGNAFIAYPSVPFTFLAEGYYIVHQVPGNAWGTYGAFALLGYNIKRVTPYLKGEYIASARDSDIPDPFYIPEPLSVHGPAIAQDLVEGTMGMRLDATTWSTIKLEYRVTAGQGTRRPDLPTPIIHSTTASWAFGI